TASLASIGCEPDLPQMDPEVHRSEIQTWQARRLEELRQPDGWLSVIGLDWLEPGENSFGSDSTNAVVFPALPGVPGTVGSFFMEDGAVRMEVEPGVQVTHEGEPVTSLELFSSEGGRPATAHLASLRWEVIQRQELIGIRLRDTANAAIEAFEGIEIFPVSLDWRIPARFDRYDPPRMIEVPNVLGQISPQPSPGAVVFRVGGERLRLDVTGNPEGRSFSIVFGDETNGLETYGGGRFLTVDAPDENGRLFIDFNKAHNPPCVYTAFATCPLPSPQNRLSVRIEAGEKSGH
ncbi:MAG: DUF1684 domain-containing protein, partial [Gemmatimonadota bacterium]